MGIPGNNGVDFVLLTNVNELINHYRIADNIITNHINMNDHHKRSAEHLLEKLYAEGFTTEQIHAKLSDSARE